MIERFKQTWNSAAITTPPEIWDQRFMRAADEAASWSKDPVPHRRAGAVLISADRRNTSSGYSGFPPGVVDTEDRINDQELKRLLTVHAELNAVLNATFDRRGSTLYVNRCPCHECAKVILCAGVARVVAPFSKPGWDHPKWGESVELAREMLEEASVAFDDADAL